MTLNKNISLFALGILLFCLNGSSLQAQNRAVFQGIPSHIADGDSFKIISRGREFEIRLSSIDAPEYYQNYGHICRAKLASHIEGQTINIAPIENDRYGRIVAVVSVGNLNINREMVRTGCAWAYRRYLNDRTMIGLETTARRQKLGLWSQPPSQIKPPWLKRQTQKNH